MAGEIRETLILLMGYTLGVAVTITAHTIFHGRKGGS